MVINLDDEYRDWLLRKKAQKRQAGTDAFYRVVNAIREEYLSENQAADLGNFVAARLGGSDKPTEEEDNKFRGVLNRQPAHHCRGDCHSNGGCGHHAQPANPFAIVDRVVDQHTHAHGCENCGPGEKITEEIKEANLAVGQFKVAAKKGLITANQLFNVLQWLRACYNYHEPAMGRSAMTEGGATVHDLAKYREDHPRPKKEPVAKTFGPDSPLFPRLLAAIQSGSFLNHQAKEFAEKLEEKFGMKFLGLPVAYRETMRDHAARRRPHLKKVEPGEVAIIIALAEHELNCQQAQCAIRWLHALYL